MFQIPAGEKVRNDDWRKYCCEMLNWMQISVVVKFELDNFFTGEKFA